MTTDQKITEIENRLRTEAKTIGVWDNHETFHLACADEAKIEGLWLEFGVFCGRSIEQLSRKCPHDIYGFDSFEGLPEEWDASNPKACFSLNGQIPSGYIIGENHSMFDKNLPNNVAPWPKNVKLVKGYFDAVLPEFVEKLEGDVALLHIDSDLYSSAKTVFDNLKPRIKAGTVIIFDELVDYPDYQNHEIKAFAEFLNDTGLGYTPLIYQNLGYSQGCFRIKYDKRKSIRKF
jgi:hypothetical protein